MAELDPSSGNPQFFPKHFGFETRDSPSLHLFVIEMEALSCLICSVEENFLVGCKIGKGGRRN